MRKLREAVASARTEQDTPRLRGMRDGAQQRLMDAENAYRGYASQHFAEVVEELAKQAADTVADMEPLWNELREARKKWWKARRAWDPLITFDAFRADDFPPSPFPDTASIPLPMPLALLDDRPVGRPRGVRTRKGTGPRNPAQPVGPSKTRRAPLGD